MRDNSATTDLKSPLHGHRSSAPTQAVASPFRLRNGSAFGFLAEEDGYIFGKGRKRTKFGRPSSEWVYVDSPPSPVEKTTDWDADDIEARLEEYESPESPTPTEVQPPSPTPQLVPTDAAISTTNGVDEEPLTEFVDDNVTPAEADDVEMRESEKTHEVDKVAAPKEASPEDRGEGIVSEDLKPTSSQDESLEGFDQDDARNLSPAPAQPLSEHEETGKEETGMEMDKEEELANEIEERSPSRASISIHEVDIAEDISKGSDLGSPAEEDENVPWPAQPVTMENIDHVSSPAFERSESPSSSHDIESGANSFPTEFGLVDLRANETEIFELREEQQELDLERIGQGLQFQGTLPLEASEPTQIPVTNEVLESNADAKILMDAISGPPERTSTAEVPNGSASEEEDQDANLTLDKEEREEARVDEDYGAKVPDDWSEASSAYDYWSNRTGEIERAPGDYEPEQSENAEYESRSDAEVESFLEDSVSELEEDEYQRPAVQEMPQPEIIVIDSDDESEAANLESEDNQLPTPDHDSPESVNVRSPSHHEDVACRGSSGRDVPVADERVDRDSRSASSQGGDATRQEPGSGKAYVWLDCAGYEADPEKFDEIQNPQSGQSFPTMERQATPEHAIQEVLEPTSHSTAVETTIVSDMQQYVEVKAASETVTQCETAEFEARETLHVETQMVTPGETQEVTDVQYQSQEHILPNDLPTPQLTQELQASIIDATDEVEHKPLTDSIEPLLEENQSPFVFPDDMEIDSASQVGDASPEALVPMALEALTEDVKEEPTMEDFVDALSTVERSTASPTPSFESAREYSQDAESQSEQISQLSSPATGLRTRLAYFCPLSRLSSSFNDTIDTIAVVASASPVSQATRPPHDHYVALHVMDSSTEGSTVCAQVFSENEGSLPVASKGDVILLGNFKVSSAEHSPMLCSKSEASSWAVFKQGDEGNVQITGPPVDYDGDERTYVSELRQWYVEEGAELFEKRESYLANRGTTETSFTGTASEVGSMGSPLDGKKRRSGKHRRKNKSTPRRLTVHELRDGRRYTDASPSDMESVHELRNGTLYAHL